MLRLPTGLEPAEVAPHADAGLTVMHVVRKAVPLLGPGTRVVVVGVGGLGSHRRCSACAALTAAEVIAVDPDPEALKLAVDCGAHHAVPADARATEVGELTGGAGAEAVIDFVGEGDAVASSLAMVRARGTYFVVGYGGELAGAHVQPGAARDQRPWQRGGHPRRPARAGRAHRRGRGSAAPGSYPLDAFADAFADLENGRMQGAGSSVTCSAPGPSCS